MPRVFHHVALALALALLSSRAETFDLRWPTSHAAKPPETKLTPEQARWLPAFRASLEWLPESTTITLALGQSQVLGLPQDIGTRITPLLVTRYEAIARDPDLANAASHLPYCYAPAQTTEGLARVTTPSPDKIATAPVVVFIHGQGGSFLWYQHWLKASLPEHILISPAYGANSAFVPSAYVEECLQAAEKRLGRRISTPILAGLSAGGFAAQRIGAAAPTRWRGVIVLGAHRAPDVPTAPWKDIGLNFIVGADEYFVRDGTLKRDVEMLRRAGARVEGAAIPGADHFFPLTHPSETERALRRALPAPPIPPG